MMVNKLLNFYGNLNICIDLQELLKAWFFLRCMDIYTNMFYDIRLRKDQTDSEYLHYKA